jgi:hypothetical protein
MSNQQAPPTWQWYYGEEKVSEATPPPPPAAGCGWVKWVLLGFVVGIIMLLMRPSWEKESSVFVDFEEYTRSIR